jgi:hypothetical protein
MPTYKGKKRVYRRRPRKSKDPVIRKSDLKAALSKTREMKHVSIQSSTTVHPDCIVDTRLKPMLQHIAPGTQATQRVGDSVNLHKIVLKGVFTLTYNTNLATASVSPSLVEQEYDQMFRLAIIKSKKHSSYEGFQNSLSSEQNLDVIMDSASGGRPLASATGTIRNMWDNINRRYFTVTKEFKRILTLPSAVGRTDAGYIAGTPLSGNHRSVWNVEYTLRFKNPFKVVYENGESVAQNFPYMLMFWRTPYSNLELTTKTASAFEYTSQAFYTDA